MAPFTSRAKFAPIAAAIMSASKRPKGTGTVYSVTTVRRKADAGGDYNVSLIDLDEGVRLMSRVAQLSPDQVKIGQRVKARVQVTDGKGMVVFDPLKEGQA